MMPAAYSVWGNMGGANYALPMNSLTPSAPQTMGYTVYWNTAAQGLDYAPLAFDPTSGDATMGGNFGVTVGKVYKVNAIQVVSARRTGWTPTTGAANRATFDPATVTLANLAGAVKALLDDLTTHGLIGA
jgi:hypothetical protein